MLSLLAPSSVFDPPSLLYTFLSSPVPFFASTIYRFFAWLRPWPRPAGAVVRLVCISDTHTKSKTIPDGDILIHAGDLTNAGTITELQEQIDWLDSLPHTHKIAIAGNHDTYLDSRSRQTLQRDDINGTLDWKGIRYLQHSGTSLYLARQRRTLRVFGAPQIPACGGPEFAFQYPRGQDAWSDTIPLDLDILITHTPPRWHLDLPAGLGCEWLLKEVWRVKPKIHVFGHVHAGQGCETVSWDNGQSAYERICSRPGGALSAVCTPANYIDLVKILFHGIKGLAWRVLWGGVEKSGLMINAALMSQISGDLDHRPQVFSI